MAKSSVALDLGLIPAMVPGSTDVVATPVSLQGGTFLAYSEEPRARALAAIAAVTNAVYITNRSSGSIHAIPEADTQDLRGRR